MRRTTSLIFAAVLLCSSARASMMEVTHDWTVSAAGGHYGLIETEFVTLSGQRVGWETSVVVGRLRFELPCRTPVTIILCSIGAALLGWYAVIAISRTKYRERQHDHIT